MKIYVPSSDRADDRLLRGPLKYRKMAAMELVVPEDQADRYRRALAARAIDGVGVLACPEEGIARTRQWIGARAAAEGAGKFCMMDDDLGFLVRIAEDKWNLRETTPAEWSEMIAWVETVLDANAHASISCREGNNRVGVGDKAALVERNTRTLRLLAYRTGEFLSVEHGRVPVMEDFDVNIQLLRAGYGNIVNFWWAQGQRMTNEPGGCSKYRTHELHEAAARRLAEIYPGLVRLRQKQNKTDAGGFGTRTEVTIAWKKAANGG